MDGSEQSTSPALHYHLVLLGKTGAGKSATGNSILGKKAFPSKLSFKTVTQEVKSESVSKYGLDITVYDTPGFFDPENELSPKEMYARYQGLPDLDTPDPLIFLLVLRPDRFTQEEKCTVEIIEDFLPDWLKKNTWIIFTRGDELEREDQTIEDLIKDSEDLKKVVEKFDNRYFVFNNVTRDPEHHGVKKLIDAIRNVQPWRSSETDAFLQRQIPDQHESGTSERRLLLLGNMGSGKSATGNTILRKNLCKSELNFSSVTKQCELHNSEVLGRSVCIIDTPGFSNLTSKPEDLAKEMAHSVALCSPGPHALLYVVSLKGKFTHEDENHIKNIERIYGQEVAKYIIPVFTHSDLLDGKSVKDLIGENETLSRFVQQCGGRYHIMNNKDMRNRKQVTELLEKIDTMTEQNGGYYSNQMFQDAQRFRREEEEKRNKDDQQGTKESWIRGAWKRVKDYIYRKFMNHFNRAAQCLSSLCNRIVKLLRRVNVTCTTGDGSGEAHYFETNKYLKHTGQAKTRQAQLLIN